MIGSLFHDLTRSQVRELLDVIDQRWPHGHYRGRPLPQPHRADDLDAEVWIYSRPGARSVLALMATTQDADFTCELDITDAGEWLEAVVDLVAAHGPNALAVLDEVCTGDLPAAIATVIDVLS